MSVTTKAALIQLKSLMEKSAIFAKVQIGECVNPPVDWTAAIFMASKRPLNVTLAGTVDERTIAIRIYVSAFDEPLEEKEFAMDEKVAKAEAAILGAFTLGGTVRNVNAVGLAVDWGYQTIGPVAQNRVYRVADLSVPVVVDDNAVLAA